MSIRLYLIISIIGITLCLSGQSPSHIVYSEKDGLPQVEYTSTVSLNDGRLIVFPGDASHFVIFDGFKFRDYLFKNLGLQLNMHKLGIKKEGIWLQEHSNKNIISLYDNNGKVHKFDIKGIMHLETFRGDDNLSYIDSTGQVYTYKEKYDIFEKQQKLHLSFKPNNVAWNIYKNSDSIYVFENKTHLYISDQNGNIINQIKILQRNLCLSKNRYFEIKNGHLVSYSFLTGKKMTSTKIKLPNIEDAKFLDWAHSSFLYNNIILVTDKNDNKHLIKIKDDGTLSYITELSNPSHSNFNIDKNNNLWYTSENMLVRKNLDIDYFPAGKNNMVTGVSAVAEDIKGNIWVGGYNFSGLCYYNEGKWHRPNNSAIYKSKILPGAYGCKNGNLYYFSEYENGIQYLDIKKQKHALTYGRKEFLGYYFNTLHDNFIGAGCMNHGLLIFDKSNSKNFKFIDKSKGLKLNNVLCFDQDRKRRIWMCRSSQGIAVYDYDHDKVTNYLIDLYNKKSFGAYAILIDNSDNLWMGSIKGLRICKNISSVDLNTFDLFNHTKEVHLPPADSNGVIAVLENKKYIIIGTEKAIHFLPKANNHEFKKIYTLWFGKEINGSGVEQNAMMIDSKGILWVGCQQGVLRIDIDSMSFDESPTTLQNLSFFVGDQSMPISTKVIKCPMNKRNILVKWECSGNAHLSNNVSYNIVIVNEKNDTLLSKYHLSFSEVEVPYLPPSDYRLVIDCIKNNARSGGQTIYFTIPKMLYESFWFWLLGTLLLISIPFIYFYFTFKHKRVSFLLEQAIQEKSKQLDKAKIQSLANFFNPHFINNSLHWVQSKHRKDLDTAVVLGSLSDNIKMLYDNAAQNQIVHRLQNEITMVENYLKIAVTRFGDKITYKLPDEDDLDNLHSDYHLPLLMLQIHAENTIEKGITSNKVNGHFQIDLVENNDTLLISCWDNGFGRLINEGTDYEIRKSSTLVMSEMIKLLNTYNDNKITIKYIDNFMEADENYSGRHGTKVMIEIPKNYKYDIH